MFIALNIFSTIVLKFLSKGENSVMKEKRYTFNKETLLLGAR